MLKRSVAMTVATVTGIAIAVSMSTVASAKPTQIHRVQSSPKVTNLRQVNPNIIKPKYTLNPKLVKTINPNVLKPVKPIKPFNPNLVGKLTPKFPPLHPPGNNNNNNNNNNTNNNTNNTNVNTNTNVNANFNSNSSVSVVDSAS